MEIAILKNEVFPKEPKRDFDEDDWRVSQDMHSLSNLQSFNDIASQNLAQEDCGDNLDITTQYFTEVTFTSNVEQDNHLQILKNHFLLLFKVHYPDEFFDKIKSKEYKTILGLEKSSKQLICFSIIHIKENKKKAALLAFGVVKEFQKKRIGSKILQKTLEELTVMGIETVTLIVQQTNANAVRLYKKFSFEIEKEMNEYYHNFEDQREKSAYLMKKTLIYKIHSNFGFFDFFRSLRMKITPKTNSKQNFQGQ
jgi:ribosomal protein S18 acetylase RimI-like enzyme